MTTTQQAGGASPVDFETFGDYGDFKRKQTAAKWGGEAGPSREGRPWSARADGTRGGPGGSSPPGNTGEFVRPAYPVQGRITADGSSGYPAVAGRYH
ncbi:MAG TPA: hypothetical protein VGR98_08930, partial [Streptosporangiaceae bacterium]|nr:hypothetical protein [Streptosporangiaceae bacterium]